MKLFLLLMDEVTMFLTWYALFDKGVAVRLHGWPKVVGFEYYVGHGSCGRMVSAYSFMEFLYDNSPWKRKQGLWWKRDGKEDRFEQFHVCNTR